jgi:hypothetical protein
MKRILWSAPLMGLLLFACFGSRQDVPGGSSAGLTATTPTRLQAPPVQRYIDLDTWRWGERFYPADVASAYTVIVTSRNLPNRFVAYGFDVRRGRAPFSVEGSLEHRARFEEQVRRDTASLPKEVTATVPMLLTGVFDPATGLDGGADGGTDAGAEESLDAGIEGEAGDGGSGADGTEPPPVGNRGGGGELPTVGPWVETYAYAVALASESGDQSGAPTVESSSLQLAAPVK